jgi:hypothetical protein
LEWLIKRHSNCRNLAEAVDKYYSGSCRIPAESRLFYGSLPERERISRLLGSRRLEPFQKLALLLLDYLGGILNCCRTKVPLGGVEAVAAPERGCDFENGIVRLAAGGGLSNCPAPFGAIFRRSTSKRAIS